MIKIAVNTNVYISIILFGGKPEEIRGLARDGKIELLTSEAILAEIAGVLKRKFNWSNLRISRAVDEVRAINTLVTPAKTLSVIKERDSDNRILECAVEGKAQCIVSGDEYHLLPLKEFEGIRIISPGELFKAYGLGKVAASR